MLSSMWLKSTILLLLGCILVCVRAAPGAVDAAKRVSWKDMDFDKVYAPNPPVTHRVLITIGYFDAEENKEQEHEISIDLYGTVTPKTVQNFVTLCRGVKFKFHNAADPEEAHSFSFKESKLHKIIANKLIQGGDVFDNSAALSIYGPYWDDENFDLKHDRPGRLSMANTGPNTQGSEFFIVTQLEPASEFDSKNVVFGQVVAGMDDLVDKIQYVETDAEGKPAHDVVLKYILVDELKLSNKDELHAAYLKKLEEFQKGDLSKGVSMGTTMALGAKEEEALDEIKFNNLHHPLFKVLIGMSILSGLYVLAKFRKRNFSKSSNIVSLRRE
ncbi:hypothetical protein HG536_0A09090 [Torulaspora globosa]|uniref:PPIase cyclophilin-type domain-containing protein n=1 Tax=Torulaspora globosa TaxID=48254 RepID=A0A7G3ZC56_9SACH|nr:uncharacterized protein HG536_0A09090 [Torulaspora globosa]QLL31092.1 hypothetical protein HG536_0A09090 [Torulaspora globosa]